MEAFVRSRWGRKEGGIRGLASRSGVSAETIYRLFNGVGQPDLATITALAVALGEKPEDYLQLAGRAVLRAENVVPATRMITLTDGELEAMLTRAAERAVRNVYAERQGPTE